jgi:hypothetical protein
MPARTRGGLGFFPVDIARRAPTAVILELPDDAGSPLDHGPGRGEHTAKPVERQDAVAMLLDVMKLGVGVDKSVGQQPVPLTNSIVAMVDPRRERRMPFGIGREELGHARGPCFGVIDRKQVRRSPHGVDVGLAHSAIIRPRWPRA